MGINDSENDFSAKYYISWQGCALDVGGRLRQKYRVCVLRACYLRANRV